MYTVLMHNDDYTTMEFVVAVLIAVFRKSPTEANRIMLHIHFKGTGICGTYPYEVAETKIGKVQAMARREGFEIEVFDLGDLLGPIVDIGAAESLVGQPFG